jgi:hypothetical protein
MPHFHAGAHDIAGARRDAADATFIDIFAGKLMRAAEEGIRCATDRQALRLGDAAKLFALLKRQNQRLFRIDVLAGFEDRLRNREMRIRDGEVDDDVVLVIGEKLVDRR